MTLRIKLNILILLPFCFSSQSHVTIPTQQLFQNTLRRWGIEPSNKQDRMERWARFLKSVISVELTTKGVKLESLNKFTVMNDIEFETRVRPLMRRYNMTEPFQETLQATKSSKTNSKSRKKRSLPATFDYWENEVGLSTPRDQLYCGSCWSFTNVGSLEAVNKALTGDDTEFSEQYFVDCTFDYSGCGGGKITDGYRLTMTRQYLLSASDYPYTGEYTPCEFTEDIANFENNAMNKIWVQDWIKLDQDEASMLEGLLTSPVAFGTRVSDHIFSYSGGLYHDPYCATDYDDHAMILVGYTETTLRVKASYGKDFGDNGYMNYARGDENLELCQFYHKSYTVLVTYRRELEYEYCNGGVDATYEVCRASCQAMNTENASGWDLAIIPTEYHNEQIMKKLAVDYPFEESPFRLNLFWIGLIDENQDENFEWLDGFTPVNYLNMTNAYKGNKYGLLYKKNGRWVTKSSETYQARGLCSRPVNCWNIENAIKNATVTFSKADLTEGTVATVKCENGLLVMGANVLNCIGGKWDQSLPNCISAMKDIGITVNPVDTAHLVGEDAVLSCTVKNPSGATPTLSWIKVDGATETAQDISLINFDNNNPGISKLTFPSVAMDKAGEYKCRAVYVLGDQTIARNSSIAKLFVRELSKKLDEYTGVLALGGTETFTCEYHGDVEVSTVTWSYNGTTSLPSGYNVADSSYIPDTDKWESVLTVSSILKSSGGEIKCTFAFTGTGDDISSTTNFRVRSVEALDAELVSSLASYTLTCYYEGSDNPEVTWTVAGILVSDDDEGISIIAGSLTANARSDEVTISGRSYSDASKAITCKYSFTNPTAELSASTLLKFRGLNTVLSSKYYSIGDAVTMECCLGVGSDGDVPSETAWFHNYESEASSGLVDDQSYDIATDAIATNGLFKSTLTINAAGISTANAGNYRCQFKISADEIYHSEGALVVRLVTISPSDANIYSYANAGLQLSCTLDASDSKSDITWTGPDGAIDSSGYSNDESDPNIHIVSLDSSATNGEYNCTFAFTEGTVPEGVFSNVNLNLLEMTSPTALYSTHGAGVSVTLTCQVTSPSQLTLTFHDGSTDLPATTTKYEGGKTIAEYTITVDGANKGGTFQCRKSATETSTTSSTLTVLSMATPLTSPTRANDGVAVTLSCVAQSHADVTPPTFSWLKDGSAVSETPYADVVAEDKSTVTSKLPIVVSSDNDGSVYKCEATYTGLASGTKLESSTTVTMNKIVPSSEVTVSTFVGEAVTLSCVATAADGVDIKWRKKASGWTADSPTYDDLTGSQDDYDTETGTRASTLTYSSPVTSDTSDSIECYDSSVGISGVMAIEVIGSCTYEGEAGGNATISPNKLKFGSGENVTITCTKTTDNCLTEKGEMNNDSNLSDTVTSCEINPEVLTIKSLHECKDGNFIPKMARCFSDDDSKPSIFNSSSTLAAELVGLAMILLLVGF